MKENFSSVSSAPESKVCGSSLLVAVCGTSSAFCQVTVVPTAIVSSLGIKLKLSILTVTVAGCEVDASGTAAISAAGFVDSAGALEQDACIARIVYATDMTIKVDGVGLNL